MLDIMELCELCFQIGSHVIQKRLFCGAGKPFPYSERGFSGA